MTDNTQSGSDNDVTSKHSPTEVEADKIKDTQAEQSAKIAHTTQAELGAVLDRHLNEIFMKAGHRGLLEQALLDWHNKRELEARIDTLEYAKISPKFKIEEKIEQLRLELKKYEQSS